jgi:glyoxylase-like metal-dependent hydrolase (beta-lactamase superfamily II)
LRDELATGVDADTGRPLAAPAREYAEQVLRDYPVLEPQYALASAAAPHITTDGGMTLPMKGRLIEIHHLGRGNTPGDLVVYLPAEKVLIAGDIVTHPVPFGYPSFPSEVVGVTEALLGFEFDYLVLGHGPVQRDRGYAEKVLALQRHAVAEIRRLHDAGLDEAEIRARLDLSPFDEAITSGDPRVAYFFDRWYRQPIVGRVLRELGSRPPTGAEPTGGS